MRIFISNSCVGAFVNKKFDMEYTSPFIGTLIPNDLEYLKLCQNLEKYMNIKPVCNNIPKDNTLYSIQNKNKLVKHRDIKNLYPIIHLNDIEIHCIHEEENNIALKKFNRRRLRMLDIIKSKNFKIYNLWSYSEFFNIHKDYIKLINDFCKIPNRINIFIGPCRLNKIQYRYYIPIKFWNKRKLTRDANNFITWNKQPFLIDVIYKYITMLDI